MGRRGAWPRPRDLLLKFWDFPNISGTAEGTKLKFSRQIDRKGYYSKKMKNGSKGGVA